MKFLIVLLYIVTVQAGVIKDENTIEAASEEDPCPGIIVKGVYYDREELKSDLDRPYQLAVDLSTNTLFFSYSLNPRDDAFKSAFINLGSNEYSELPVYNGFAQTVDQKNHVVYIGGGDGLYKYDGSTKSPKLFGLNGTDIWSIHFKDVLYYANYPLQFLYTYANGESKRYKNLEHTKVDQFVIDNEDVLFFTNWTGLFSQKKDTKDAILYQEYPDDRPRQLAIDLKGDVYVCTDDGIYKVNKDEISLNKVLNINDCFGLAFDNENNIIYSNANTLFRIKPNKDREKICH